MKVQKHFRCPVIILEGKRNARHTYAGQERTPALNDLFSVQTIQTPKWRVFLGFRWCNFEGFFRTAGAPAGAITDIQSFAPEGVREGMCGDH